MEVILCEILHCPFSSLWSCCSINKYIHVYNYSKYLSVHAFYEVWENRFLFFFLGSYWIFRLNSCNDYQKVNKLGYGA